MYTGSCLLIRYGLLSWPAMYIWPCSIVTEPIICGHWSGSIFSSVMACPLFQLLYFCLSEANPVAEYMVLQL